MNGIINRNVYNFVEQNLFYLYDKYTSGLFAKAKKGYGRKNDDIY